MTARKTGYEKLVSCKGQSWHIERIVEALIEEISRLNQRITYLENEARERDELESDLSGF